MLEVMADRQILFIFMGIFTALGVISKCVVNITLKKLIKAAGNMNKSAHALMRLVRAKFEHACMVSDRVQNVGVFVEKYLYEYKVAGLKLYAWRRAQKWASWLCLCTGLLAAAAEYILRGMGDQVLKDGAAGAALAIILFLFHLTTDENYQMAAVKTYMVDYLENVCARRYEKSLQKELKVMAPPETPAADLAEKASVEAKPEAKAKEGAQSAPRENAEDTKEAVLMGKEPVSGEEKLCEAAKTKACRKEEAREEDTKMPLKAARDTQGKKTREKQAEEKQPSKEVMIREILEEFLA